MSSVIVWCRRVYRRKPPGNTQNGETILPIVNLMADSESGSPDSYSSFLVTICPSHVVSQIFTCDRQTDGGMDNADLFFQWSCSYKDVHNETGSAGRVSRLVTVPTDPFTRPAVPFLSEWVNCQPKNTQNGRTVLPITNLMADSESGSPDSYASFLVTRHLSCLVLKIFTCDRQMDGRTMQIITIAGPHIVVGQLKYMKA